MCEKKKYEFSIKNKDMSISGTFTASESDRKKFMNMIFESCFCGYVCEVQDED